MQPLEWMMHHWIIIAAMISLHYLYLCIGSKYCRQYAESGAKYSSKSQSWYRGMQSVWYWLVCWGNIFDVCTAINEVLETTWSILTNEETDWLRCLSYLEKL